MGWRTLVAVLAIAIAIGCSGERSTQGSCSLSAMGWLCTSAMADTSRTVASCTVAPVAGGACAELETVDTTSTTQPAHVTAYPECFACSRYGSGTDWTCTASGWQVGAIFSCSP